MKSAILLIGFGGPTSHDRIRPFLESVLEGVPVLPERFEEVVKHYELIGGISTYNSITYEQKKALEIWLKKNRMAVPVWLGFRHAKPSFVDLFQEMKEKNIDRVIGIVLSSFRCHATFQKYQQAIKKAQTSTDTSNIDVVYSDSFHKNPLFLKAQVERVKELTDTLAPSEISKTFFLFTAHSIPVSMAKESGYDKQFSEAASSIAGNLRLKNWGLAYQSRSGRPGEAWLEPALPSVVSTLSKEKIKNVVLVPVGFLADHAEVVYDLDVEAKKIIEELGFRYFRCRTLMDHPQLIELLGTLVKGML